ncbi:MAG: hypothetical protein AB7N65_00015 [Vicinamibacterales bacterium]
MADTSVQGKVERWIVQHELSRVFEGRGFSKRRVALTWGGAFEFDAVSADGDIVACVSTSCCRTASGRSAIGKFHKLKADALYLLHTTIAKRRVMVFTDGGMLAHFERERSRGRFPSANEIELLLVSLPDELASELREATRSASFEVSPRTLAE